MDGLWTFLLPERFQGRCLQHYAAWQYWVAWRVSTALPSTSKWQKLAARSIPDHREAVFDMFCMAGCEYVAVRHLLTELRIGAVLSVRRELVADEDEQAERKAASRAAFASGRYDRCNLVAFRHRPDDQVTAEREFPRD